MNKLILLVKSFSKKIELHESYFYYTLGGKGGGGANEKHYCLR